MQHEVEKVMSVGELHQLPHWKVYYGVNIKSQQIYCSSESIQAPMASLTWESSKGVLQSYLMLLPEGTYTIHFKPEPGDKQGFKVLVFKITADPQTAIAGVQQIQPYNQVPPQFMMQQMMQYMTAEIGRVTTDITARFEQQRLSEKISDLEKKLKQKAQGTGFDLVKFIDRVEESFYKAKALHDADKLPAKVAIGITGKNAANVPAPETETEEDETETPMDTNEPVIRVTTAETAQLYNETIKAFVEFFGSGDETVVQLSCLIHLLKTPKGKQMYDAFIVPELKRAKEELGL